MMENKVRMMKLVLTDAKAAEGHNEINWRSLKLNSSLKQIWGECQNAILNLKALTLPLKGFSSSSSSPHQNNILL